MLIAVLVSAGVVLGPTVETPSVVVIDRELHATSGELVSFRDGSATLRHDGKETTVAHAVALVGASSWGPGRDWPGLPGDPSPETTTGMVTVQLTDGTLLRGDLLAGKGDGLVLVDKQLGKVEFPLDSLTELTTHGEPSADVSTGKGGGGGGGGGERDKGDTVLFANGDRLEGFIESIAPAKDGDGTALAVSIEHEKVKTAVPLERVASVTLRGGSRTKPDKVVWLAGGTKTGAAEFSIVNGEARLVRTKASLAATVKAGGVDGALLDTGTIVPLAQCAVRAGRTIETGPVQTLGTRDLTLPEPGQAAWELPKGAKRISGWAVLPEECRKWGDCTVTIAVAGPSQSREQKLVEFTLNGTNPVVAIDQALPAVIETGAWLSVTVGEGKNGPVQDRVVLRRVLVEMDK